MKISTKKKKNCRENIVNTRMMQEWKPSEMKLEWNKGSKQEFKDERDAGQAMMSQRLGPPW